MSNFGVAAIAIISIIVVLLLTTLGLGIWSLINHKYRKPTTPEDDEERRLDHLMSTASKIPLPPPPPPAPPLPAHFPNLTAIPATTAIPISATTPTLVSALTPPPPVQLKESYLSYQEQLRNHNDNHDSNEPATTLPRQARTRRFSFDKTSIDGLEQIDIAKSYNHADTPEQKDPYANLPSRQQR